jgi:hypothetical protein
MQTLTAAIQDEVARVLLHHAPDCRVGRCLYVAHATATVLHKAGLRPVIQAGSLQWPIMNREDDDGIGNTHFAYMWSPTSAASLAAIAAGLLPEMHVWCGLVEPQTLIDFSTGDLRRHAEACGLVWRSADPPEYLIATAGEMPDWVVYTPNRDATLYAYRILNRLFHPAYMEKTRT